MTHMVEVRRKRYDEKDRTSYYFARAIYLNKNHYEEWGKIDKRELRNYTKLCFLRLLPWSGYVLVGIAFLCWLTKSTGMLGYVNFAAGGFALWFEFHFIRKPRLRSDELSCILQKKKILAHYGISATDPGTAALENVADYYTTWTYVLRCN